MKYVDWLTEIISRILQSMGPGLRIGGLIAVVLIVFLCAAAALKIILYIFGRDRVDGRRS